MANFRIFVEKKPKFNVEAQQLLADLKLNLHLDDLYSVRIINLYDIFNIRSIEMERAKYVVFAEAAVDEAYAEIDLSNLDWFAVEPLPGQYDQRADSALQALNLLGINNPDLSLTSGKLIIIEARNILDKSSISVENQLKGNNLTKRSINSVINRRKLTAAELAKIKDYYINPLEVREKDLSRLGADNLQDNYQPIPVYTGFNRLSDTGLENFRNEHGLAMSFADLSCIQDYFVNSAKREPTETEIKVLDTYWSDHCRHTTFETHLTQINFTAGKYQELFQNAFASYQASRNKVYGTNLVNKPITLMDLATICAKEFRKDGILNDVEISDEINACSVLVDIKIDGCSETWSLQFKNETHNHPTEIEPYGGASTCVGGAIRDPLSGRAYVYQAMRISGASDPLEAVEATLSGKLPQRKIVTKAASGFAGYGNQIGLTTTHVKEIYHPGYKAKRMEVGMVVAAAPYANIRREQPVPGDVIILLGGRTGRDGCGGATGSSKEHDINSAAACGAEVQKGNPLTERKIQRLFRNPQATRLIKKCNDFGAGGVSVAIGELADGVKINLDKVPTKYHGLTGTELAISESQERMAVVVAAGDTDKFIKLAAAENLEATAVAEVTQAAQMIMYWHGQEIVNLERNFLNTNGAKSYAEVEVLSPDADRLLVNQYSQEVSFSRQLKNTLADLNNCSQQGMVNMFDATIGAATVLMPYGGKYQLTPSQVSVQKFPVLVGETDAASIASYGFDPFLSSKSPFHGAFYAVVDSVAKIVASGVDHTRIKFSFQEYFEKLGDDKHKWGKPFAALLGAYTAQQGFQLAAIGGKDSMSGTFNDLHVPPTLISFAVASTYASEIISPEFKAADNYIYAFIPAYDQNELIDIKVLTKTYQRINQLIKAKKINAAQAIGYGGIADTLAKMSFGNKIGISIMLGHGDNSYPQSRTRPVFGVEIDLFAPYYGGIVFAANERIADLLKSNQFSNDPKSENISNFGLDANGSEYISLNDADNFILLGKTILEQSIRFKNEVIELEELISVWQAKLAPVFPIWVPESEIKGTARAIDSLNFRSEKTKPFINSIKRLRTTIAKPRIIIPIFPGTNCEYDSIRAFNQAGGIASSIVFSNLTAQHIEESIAELAREISQAQILMLPGGFSAGDEPDGSAKFIATILQNSKIKEAIRDLLARDGLILGICNGFQALIKSGLLPYAEVRDLDAASPTLTYNLSGRHISRVTATRIINNHSPWLSSFTIGDIKQVAMSHTEGRFVIDSQLAIELFANGQIACQYVDLEGNPTLDGVYNPNGSDYAIEAITSLDGRILGKMGHSERKGSNLYKNIVGDKVQDIFANGVNYFK